MIDFLFRRRFCVAGVDRFYHLVNGLCKQAPAFRKARWRIKLAFLIGGVPLRDMLILHPITDAIYQDTISDARRILVSAADRKLRGRK